LLVVSHRWTALVFGLLLVIVSTSGALIVYEPEMLRASNSELFRTTPADGPVTFSEAIDAVGPGVRHRRCVAEGRGLSAGLSRA
jgi:uncharacterized iron-regulated membrane protein